MFYVELFGSIVVGLGLFTLGAFVGSKNPTQTSQVHKDLDTAIGAAVAEVHALFSAKIKAK